MQVGRTLLRGEGIEAEVVKLLWEERERRRAEILAAVDCAEASLARGEGRTLTEESSRQVAQDVKSRGRAKLTSNQASRR